MYRNATDSVNTYTNGSFFCNEQFWGEVKNQNLAGKADAMMKLEIGALATIGAATGAYYWGPAVAAGGSKALSWTAATGTALGSQGMNIARATHARTMMFLQDHPVLLNAIIEYGSYFKGLLTPPSPTGNFPEGLGTATSIINSD